MAASKWTVQPLTEKVNFTCLGEQCWIECKLMLSVGEQKAVDTAGFRGMTGFGKVEDEATGDVKRKETAIDIDWKSQAFARVLAYVLDWSFTDENNNKIPVRPSTVYALIPQVFEAVEQALNKHVEDQQAKQGPQAGSVAPSQT